MKNAEAGTPEWCAFNGATQADYERPRVWRFSREDEDRIVGRLKDAPPNKKEKKPHVPTIRKVVKDSGGGLVFGG